MISQNSRAARITLGNVGTDSPPHMHSIFASTQHFARGLKNSLSYWSNQLYANLGACELAKYNAAKPVTTFLDFRPLHVKRNLWVYHAPRGLGARAAKNGPFGRLFCTGGFARSRSVRRTPRCNVFHTIAIV